MPANQQLSEKRAFFLVGPTATGKTAVAQWIAERHDFDILSADSMLVYRGLDVGTAKPGREARARVRYWGIDLVEVGERFSVGDYRAAALRALDAAAAAGRRVIVVGGTGLYVKSLTDGLDRRLPPDLSVRARAARLLETDGITALQAWLKSTDTELYQSLPDQRNPRRLIRALEGAVTGAKMADKSWKKPDAAPRIPGLRLPPAELYDRITARIREMYSGGLVEETRQLLAGGFDAAPTARQAIGYAEAIAVIRGECNLQEAIEQTALRTRRLAKRQMTWFRHQARVDWLEITAAQSTDQVAAMVLEHWRRHGPTPIAE